MDEPNRFDAPIPGQSLTVAPGTHPFEKPPKYTKLDDAMSFLFQSCTQTNNLHRLLAMMESGISIEAIAKTLLFAGFSQGLWTPDLYLLMMKPTAAMLMAIAKKAGIPVRNKINEADKTANFIADLAAPTYKPKPKVAPQAQPMSPPSGGFIPMGGK